MKASQRARKFGAKIIKGIAKRDLINRDGFACYLCGEILTEQTATMEHLTPLSRGGNHHGKNLKLACYSCNTKKGNLTLAEYLNKEKPKAA